MIYANVCMQIRRDTVRSIYRAGSGHPGSSLSAVELMATLYFTDIFTCFPDRPHAPERDRFVLSKGHAAPAFYSTLAHKGYFPLELARYAADGRKSSSGPSQSSEAALSGLCRRFFRAGAVHCQRHGFGLEAERKASAGILSHR